LPCEDRETLRHSATPNGKKKRALFLTNRYCSSIGTGAAQTKHIVSKGGEQKEKEERKKIEDSASAHLFSPNRKMLALEKGISATQGDLA